MSSSPSLTLNGKIAIVTGASRGIGAQIAYVLATRGAKVDQYPCNERDVPEVTMTKVLGCPHILVSREYR